MAGNFDGAADSPETHVHYERVNLILFRMPNRDTRAGNFLDQFASLGGVGVDHGSLGVGIAPLDQVFGKKSFFAVPIGLHVSMIVQVILTQIGENSDI